MSQMKMFSVRDTKTEIYGPPFYSITHGEAERSFRQLANDPQSKVNKFPEDFDLYHIGEFDDETGKIEALPSPKHVIKAINALAQPKQ